MLENMTEDELITLSVELKKDIEAIKDKRRAINEELRQRALKAELAAMSSGKRDALMKALNVTVTPAPAVLNAKGV
jgi:hypothetical protein